MKISIKLLKGDLFHIEADGPDTVAVLKEKIQASKPDFAAERQKLIHAGKVLKDNQTISEIGVTETDFIVCMITKETKPKEAASPSPAPAPASTLPVTSSTTTQSAPSTTVAPITSNAIPQPAAVPTLTTSQVPISQDSLNALIGMGFPEAECRAALTAAMGNPDLAYEFLLTGIPDQSMLRPRISATNVVATPQNAELTGIQALRNHPQFNMLKQLIQSNPSALPQVLELIGQQSPQLLDAIHADENAFLAMMNEPITNTPAVPSPQLTPQVPPAASAGMENALSDPTQMFQLLAAMPPAQRAQFAQQIGLSPEQLNMFMQMVQHIPPAQLQQMLASGMAGAGAGAGMPPPGAITLTHEEMESVNRLMALGFSQAQAAQAFIACDRNETLAANFLFENGWGDEDDGGAGGDGPDDNMYS